MGQELLHVGSDGFELFLFGGSALGEHLASNLSGSGGRLDLGGGGIIDETLLGLAVLPGEEDELRFVGVESLDIQLELLLAGRGASVVHSDANGASESGAQTGSLDLGKRESAAVPDLASVAAGRGRHDGAQLLEGSGEQFLALGNSLLTADVLLGGLVEVHSDSGLPVLAEMYVWDDVVVLDHC